MIAERYKPTTQKSLFHKDIVNHIRKWIKMIEDYADDSRSVKQILFLYGPIGCSKTVTVECLFKGYNLINVDSDNIRSIEKISEVIQSIVSFREMTLANIDKWNHKNRKEKSNVLFIDNLELCDRGIENFIESVHVKHNIDIPIIMVCNSSKYKDLFINYKNCTFLEFKRPSLLELTKLSTEIVTSEKLELSKDQIRIIIDKSEFDVRQLLFLLQQWSLSKNMGHQFDIFIDTIQVKHTDQDLSEKLEFLFNNRKEFKMTDIFTVASSEPQALSNSIYQNYIYTPNNINVNLSKEENINLLNNYSKIMDSISDSNLIHSEIYENQNWNLYNDYTFHSTVVPSYYIKQNNQMFYKKYFTDKDEISDGDIREWNDKMYEFSPFKDISYNFINSYQEVKRVSMMNMYSHIYNPGHKTLHTSNILREPESCFTIVKILVHCMEELNEYFSKNKKGKNTSKKEKLDLCDNISKGSAKISLDVLVNNIYDYKLFEIDTDDFLINKSKYTDDEKIKQNVQKIDLRVFKRFLNIFTMDDKHKTFKSHIETSLQYKILQRLVNEYKEEPAKLSHDINNILTEDLDKIWNLS